jgi:hypothetical protein
MPTFAVPQDYDIAHAVLGMLLDRANLRSVHLDGRHDLTISLARDDVAILEALGIVQGQGEEMNDDEIVQLSTPHDPSEDAAHVFEFELTELQQRADRALARVQMAA